MAKRTNKPKGVNLNVVIGIDPGAGGAIVTYADGWIIAEKMPKNIEDIVEIVDTYGGQQIAFVEAVSSWVSDASVPGKRFGIEKMIRNYQTILNALAVAEVPYVTLHPATWQKRYKKAIKGADKKSRKGYYKHVAKLLYPSQDIYLWNADAYLIMHFGRVLCKTNAPYIYDNVKDNVKQRQIWIW